ncbi:MAG TPA: high-affinity nickel-transporter [Dehalococcoidia bacterium]|jgi:ABC-type nickel/cobalt efflux system permease component RcnA
MAPNSQSRRSLWRRRGVAIGAVALLGALLVTAVAGMGHAAAHPLGNFTVNRYARVELGAGHVRVKYVLDMAEIPALQEKNDAIDRNHDGVLSDEEKNAYAAREAELLKSGLHIAIDGADVDLSVAAHNLSFPAGQGGLDTLRLDAGFDAPLAASASGSVGSIAVKDDNYGERLGWRELIVKGVGGVTLSGSTAPTTDVTNELRSYPQDALSSPLDVRSAGASFTLDPAADASAAAALPAFTHDAPAVSGVPRTEAGFTELITRQKITADFLILALLAALLFGGLHAMGPGHGKTIVAAYLVGSRGTAKHALVLGLTVTATHTAGVFALGFVTLSLSQYILPERLYPWLSLASGLIVLVMGLALLYTRLRAARRPAHDHLHEHDHTTEHGHTHHADDDHSGQEHAHSQGEHTHGWGPFRHAHATPGAGGATITWRSLVGLGISGGILPCPSALVVLLTAISLHRVALGMVLIVAFSLGLASVLTGFGLLLLHAGRLFRHVRIDGRLLRLLPVGSALAVLVAGALITAQTLPQAGSLHP